MKKPSTAIKGIPRFVSGIDYARTEHPRWPYYNIHDISLQFVAPIMPAGFVAILLSGDLPCGSLKHNTLTVFGGYTWNGNSFWFDTEGTLLASLFHDLLFQFSGCPNWPAHLTRTWADLVYSLASRGIWGDLNTLGLSLFSFAFWGRPRPGLTVRGYSTIEPV